MNTHTHTNAHISACTLKTTCTQTNLTFLVSNVELFLKWYVTLLF